MNVIFYLSGKITSDDDSGRKFSGNFVIANTGVPRVAADSALSAVAVLILKKTKRIIF
jgi:hypothetical protein